MAIQPKRPNKRRLEGGRVTPKGGPTKRHFDAAGPDASSRYTPPVPISYRESPRWVPILMFALWIVGAIVIILYYLVDGFRHQLVLFGGLAMILGGLYTATKYK